MSFIVSICPLLANTLTSLHVSLLEGRVQHLVAPVLLREVFQGAAVGLHLLIQPAAVDQHRGTALGVPASLTEHLLQLLDGVAALPFADAVLLHAAVAAPQSLYVMGRMEKGFTLFQLCRDNCRKTQRGKVSRHTLIAT